MNEKLEPILATKENELASFCSAMEAIKSHFVDVTSAFASKWYEDTARQYLTKYSDVSINLSTDRFSDLKLKVKHILAKSRQITEKALSQPGIWWHEKPELHSAISQYDQLGNQQVGNKYPEVIDGPIRVALGELGHLLEEFGFKVRTTAAYGSSNHEYWFQKSETKIVSPYFPHMLEWSKQMQETLQEYNQLYKKALVKLHDIQTIKDELKRRKIMDLWDSTP
jgi:hypothetical protein